MKKNAPTKRARKAPAPKPVTVQLTEAQLRRIEGGAGLGMMGSLFAGMAAGALFREGATLGKSASAPKDPFNEPSDRKKVLEKARILLEDLTRLKSKIDLLGRSSLLGNTMNEHLYALQKLISDLNSASWTY